MTSYLWRKYADYLHTKWEKTILWDMIEPYRRPKSFTPLVTIYICAFYTGVVAAAITEQRYKSDLINEYNLNNGLCPFCLTIVPVSVLHSSPTQRMVRPWAVRFYLTNRASTEKYWEDHPGEVVPLMKPRFYGGPWKVIRGEVPVYVKE